MPTVSTIAVFMLAAGALLIIPGPSVLYIVARGIDQGRKAALVSALGVGVGTLGHVAAATLGLSALLVSSATAFTAVKYLGAAYLVYLGLRTLLTRESVHAETAPASSNLGKIFRQGVLVNLFNPKTALFFFAFLPQFIDPDRGSVAVQTLVLGGVIVVMGVFSDGGYALLSGTIGSWLKGNLGFFRAQRYVASTIYLALGVATAFTGHRRK
jgi:threonine/homoserine/homoserine lactone efflux protein